MSLSRKKLYLTFFLIALAGLLLIFSSMNIGTGIVRDEAVKAVNSMLGADLMIGDISGNPFRGYRIRDVEIIRDKQSLLALKNIMVKPRVMSLLSGSPRISMLEIEGFESDVDRINSIIGSLHLEGDGGENPLEKVRIVDSMVTSKWARGKINEVTLEFPGAGIKSDLDVELNELPVKGTLSVLKAENILDLEELDLAVGQGQVSARGAILPALEVKGQISDLDLAQLVSFWPEADQSSYEGTLTSSFQAEGTWEKPNISGDMKFDGKRLAGIPLSRASSKWRYRDARLDVAGLDADPMAIPLKGDLAFVFRDAAPSMLIDMSADSVNLTSLKELYPALGDVEGTVDQVRVKLQGKVSQPDGQISFKAGQLRLMGYSLENSDVEVKISKGNMQLKGRSEYDKAPLSFSGSVASFMTSPTLDIRGSLRSLNLGNLVKIVPALAELKPEGILDGDVRVAGKPDLPKVSGKIWSKKLKVMNEEFLAPSTLFSYSNDNLHISEMKAAWRGAALSGSGKLSALSTDSRKIDMEIRSDGMDSGFFEKFVPAVSEYSLVGKVSAKLGLTGILPEPALKVDIFSSSLSIMDQYRFANLKASTSFPSLPAKVPEDLALDLSASSVSVAGLSLKDLAVGLDKKGRNINIRESRAVIGKGALSGSGSVLLAEKEKGPELDLNIKADAVDLALLTSSVKDMQPMAGVLTGEATVKGPLSDPSFTVKGSSPSITAGGMKVQDLNASLGGNMSLVNIEKLQARAGGGTLDIAGEVRPKDSNADLSVKGSGLDLSVLTAGLPQAGELGIAGKMNIDFNGHFEEGKNSGSGQATSEQLQAMGIKVTGVSYPLSLKGNTLSVKDGKGSLYGGAVKGEGSLDISTMKFSKNVEVSGTDVNAMLKDAFGLKGNITGKAQLFAKIKGEMSKGLSYSGNGLLKVGNGEISGFKGVTLAAALYGLKSIRYQSVYAPFDIGTGNIVLKDKTEVTAFEKDPLYKYLKAKGKIGPEAKLDLSCNGNFNMQLLNILMGGVAGGLTSEKSIEGILQGIVKGAGEQTGKEDFRDASFRLKGTFQKPSISDVKVAAAPEAEKKEQPAEQKVIEEKVTQPVEEVKTGTTEQVPEVKEEKDLEEQVKEEILKQIFKK